MLIVLALFFTIVASANAHVLSGYVLDMADNPLEDITVRIEDATSYWLTDTDTNGYFEFTVLTGYYGIFVNDDSPISWEYTGAGLGYYSPPLHITSDIQINFNLVKTYVSFKTNLSEYPNGDIIAHNGDMIEVELTVENNEYTHDLIDWEVWAGLYSWNGTHYKLIDEDYYRVDIGYETTESFPLYIEIPLSNTYNVLYLDAGIWAYGIPFESSQGSLEGDLWNWYGTEIFIERKLNLNLSKGWNLISIPLILEDNSAEQVLSSVDYSSLYYYNSEYEVWEAPTKINNTEGYWIKLNNDDTLTVEGIVPIETLITLYEGWNLVGFPLLEELNITDTIFVNDAVYAYDGSWSSYIPERTFNTLTKLNPGFAYWVNVK